MSIIPSLRRVEGISNTATGIGDVLGRLGTGSYFSQLKPASFAGISFGVLEGVSHFGRRQVVHQYPFRDTPWVEDLGRAAQRIEITGFLVGDDVIARRDALIKKCEAKGDATLVHPTLGIKKVALLDFSSVERWDQGRVFEVQFSFVEQGRRQFPTTKSSGAQDGTSGAASKLANAKAFAKRSYAALKGGVAVANEAIKQANAWSKRARQVITDATALGNLAASLPGQFGRLLGQSRGIELGQLVPRRQRTVRELAGEASASRLKLGAAADAMDAAAANISPTTMDAFTAAAQALAAAVSAAAPTPGDALRALSQLRAFVAVGSAPSGDALTARGATTDMLRRAAAVEMVLVAATYRPASANDARDVRQLVADALDAEITTAGNQGEDEVFLQLRDLRSKAMQDLNERGAQVPTLITVSMALPTPSLVLAQRLYRDPTRSDELVRRANPRHPAFMPISFKALGA